MQVEVELTQLRQGEVQPTQIWLTGSMNIVGWQVVTQVLEELIKYVPLLQVKQWEVEPLQVLQLAVQAEHSPLTPVKPEAQVVTQLVP